jgi:hypothetical protein
MTFDITDQVEALIDAAIARDLSEAPELRQLGFIRMGTALVLYNGATGGQTVLPSRHGWDGDPSQTADPAITTAYGQPVTAIWRKWEDRIYQLFYPYKTMPLPEGFEGSKGSLEKVMQRLAINPETFPSVESGDTEDMGWKVDGNDRFSLISSADSTLSLMQGETIEAFRKYYVNRFPIVVQRQYGLTQMLYASVVAEQELWRRVQGDVTRLVKEADDAFWGNGAGAIPWAVIGTISSLLGLVPALKPVTTFVTPIANALGKIPASEPQERQFDLGGSTAEEIWSSLQKARDSLDKAAAGPEKDVAAHMRTLAGMMSSDAASFDLNAINDPRDGNSTSEGHEMETETDPDKVLSDKGVMNLEFKSVYDIGQDLKDVSTEFSAASAELDGALASGAWSRSSGIGMGFIGHYEETAALRDALATVLHNTYQCLDRTGDIIQIAAKRIQHVDESVVAGELRRHKQQVDQVEQAEAYAG